MKKYLESAEDVLKALEEEKTVYEDNSAAFYRMINGVIVSYIDDKCLGINAIILFHHKPYILEEEPLEFKVGEFYETRDHQKARCFKHLNGFFHFSIDNFGTFNTYHNGQLFEDTPHQLDIIGPWKGE